jgi:hypothetical protein
MEDTKKKILMHISDEAWPSNKYTATDNYFNFEGFKYALREWRKWTRDIIYSEYCSDDNNDNNEYEINNYTRADYITQLMRDLIKYVSDGGYRFLYSDVTLARRYMHYWLALSNSRVNYIVLPEPHHNGRQNDFEEWEQVFPYTFWDSVLEDYDIFTDNTDISYRMRQDLPYFLWLYIDIDNSERVQKRRAEERAIEYEMNKLYDDYEGYKRTDVSPAKKTENSFDSDKDERRS